MRVQRIIPTNCQLPVRTIILLLAVVSFLLPSCSKKTSGNGGVLLRIENRSGTVFDSVEVISPGGRNMYYNIQVSQQSAYKSFTFIYNYAYIKAYSGNRLAVAQPTDYVGEVKITEGYYTYRLTPAPAPGPGPGPGYLTIENHRD